MTFERHNICVVSDIIGVDMKKPSRTIIACGGAALILGFLGNFLTSAAVGTSPDKMEVLKSGSLATLSKLDPHAPELVNKATQYAAKVKQANANSPLGTKLQKAIEHITYGSSGLTNAQ